jgi:hypothetical protein
LNTLSLVYLLMFEKPQSTSREIDLPFAVHVADDPKARSWCHNRVIRT